MRAVWAATLALILSAPAGVADPAAGLHRAIEATLVVHADDATESFLGSAFLWGDGHIALTCAHVVDGAPEVRVTFADGHDALARVLARDPLRDVAVLAVAGGEDEGLAPAPGPAELGQTVYAVGAPLGVEFTVTRGMASARPRQFDPAVPIRLVQHDAAVNNGNSGGPLVDAEGRVLGMNSQIVNGAPNFIGLSFAISVEDLQRIVPRLLAGTLQPIPHLGLKVRAVNGEIAAALKVKRRGLLVDEVAPGGIAARAGLAAGDIITGMDHQALASPGEIAFRLESAAAYGKATLGVDRGRERLHLVLDLGPPVRHPPAPPPSLPATFAWADLGLSLSADGTVTGVEPGRVAELAGVKPGAQLVAVNGEPLAGSAGLAALMAQPVKAPVLLLIREGAETTHVVLDPWHPWFNPQLVNGVGAGPDQVAF